MGLENIGMVKVTSISLIGSSQARECMLRVYTRGKIGKVYEKAIRQAWDESLFSRKRRIAVEKNEIRIYLKKGDTAQKYIDCISEIINRIRCNASSSRNLKKNRKIKVAVIKRMHPSRFIVLGYRPIVEKTRKAVPTT